MLKRYVSLCQNNCSCYANIYHMSDIRHMVEELRKHVEKISEFVGKMPDFVGNYRKSEQKLKCILHRLFSDLSDVRTNVNFDGKC